MSIRDKLQQIIFSKDYEHARHIIKSDDPLKELTELEKTVKNQYLLYQTTAQLLQQIGATKDKPLEKKYVHLATWILNRTTNKHELEIDYLKNYMIDSYLRNMMDEKGKIHYSYHLNKCDSCKDQLYFIKFIKQKA